MNTNKQFREGKAIYISSYYPAPFWVKPYDESAKKAAEDFKRRASENAGFIYRGG